MEVILNATAAEKQTRTLPIEVKGISTKCLLVNKPKTSNPDGSAVYMIGYTKGQRWEYPHMSNNHQYVEVCEGDIIQIHELDMKKNCLKIFGYKVNSVGDKEVTLEGFEI